MEPKLAQTKGSMWQFVNVSRLVNCTIFREYCGSPDEIKTSVSASPLFVSVTKKWVVECVRHGITFSGGGSPARVTVPCISVSTSDVSNTTPPGGGTSVAGTSEELAG